MIWKLLGTALVGAAFLSVGTVLVHASATALQRRYREYRAKRRES